MALTEEQRKRMEENRKRAMEIRKKKQLEKEKNEKVMATAKSASVFDAGGFVGKSSETIETENKKRRIDECGSGGVAAGMGKAGNRDGIRNENKDAHVDDDECSLEDFERDASPYVSKTEAQKTYCIPLGTIEVCSYVERDNPHQKGWSKMKLYHRSEVRRRAWKRFGGKEGLIAEREKRKKRRFEKDMEEVKDVFR